MIKLIGLKNIRYELDSLKEIPHILFTGPRGTGKTTLARYLAETKKKKLIFTTGNTLKKNELLNIFINLEEGDILLIDEIHRLLPAIEEMLYQPMENFILPIKDYTGHFQLIKLPKFCVIGTTTKPSKISKPLMSRFQLVLQIPHYSVRELARIIKQNFSISNHDALQIAINVVTPREAVNLAYRVLQLNKNNISRALEFIGYKHGLSQLERYYMKILQNAGKLSLSSICSALQLDQDEVSYIEDKLLRKGLIEITNRGRSLSVKGLIKVKSF